MNKQYKSPIYTTNVTQNCYKRKIRNWITFVAITIATLMNTTISQAMPPCNPYPLCLTTPQQKATNLLNNLPSNISNNRFVQGGFIPGLRSTISPLLDTRFPLFPFQNNFAGFGGGNTFSPIFQGGFSGGSAFAPINFQVIDQHYGSLFRLGFGILGFQ